MHHHCLADTQLRASDFFFRELCVLLFETFLKMMSFMLGKLGFLSISIGLIIGYHKFTMVTLHRSLIISNC